MLKKSLVAATMLAGAASAQTLKFSLAEDLDALDPRHKG